MKREDNNRLLRELLANDELAGLRDRSLDHMLASARRRRQHRRIAVASVLATATVLLIGGSLLIRALRTHDLPVASSPSVTPAVPAPAAASETVKFITDEELFALFPNRPLALIGRPGEQQLVFLDQKSATP